MRTKWFIVADMGTGPRPLMNSRGKIALIEDLSGVETLMIHRGAIRWQAYVWEFPEEEKKIVKVIDEMQRIKMPARRN